MIRKLRNYFFIRKLKKLFPKVVFGSNFQLEDKSTVNNLVLSEYIYIGAGANFGAKGKIIIGSNVIMGQNVVICTYNHIYESKEYLPYGFGYEDKIQDTLIEKNVWIGRGVLILPGVHIGEGAVIGANSVVTRNVPSLSIVGGNPARIIKNRDSKRYEHLNSKNKYYLKTKWSE